MHEAHQKAGKITWQGSNQSKLDGDHCSNYIEGIRVVLHKLNIRTNLVIHTCFRECRQSEFVTIITNTKPSENKGPEQVPLPVQLTNLIL